MPFQSSAKWGTITTKGKCVQHFHYIAKVSGTGSNFPAGLGFQMKVHIFRYRSTFAEGPSLSMAYNCQPHCMTSFLGGCKTETDKAVNLPTEV